jgi:hypothetical protein
MPGRSKKRQDSKAQEKTSKEGRKAGKQESCIRVLFQNKKNAKNEKENTLIVCVGLPPTEGGPAFPPKGYQPVKCVYRDERVNPVVPQISGLEYPK